jgi:Na+-driven multidrug efflux pump
MINASTGRWNTFFDLSIEFNMRRAQQPSANVEEQPSSGGPAAAGPSLADLTRRELGGRLAGLSLSRQVLVLAIWPFLEQLLNFLVGFTDTAVAGHISVPATNALIPGAYIEWLIGLLQMAVSVGASAIIARAIGGRHKRLANAALGQAVVMGFAWGFVIGAASTTILK